MRMRWEKRYDWQTPVVGDPPIGSYRLVACACMHTAVKEMALRSAQCITSDAVSGRMHASPGWARTLASITKHNIRLGSRQRASRLMYPDSAYPTRHVPAYMSGCPANAARQGLGSNPRSYSNA